MKERLAGLPPRARALRQHLPYGIWVCADDREVLFNRDYKPIWQRIRVGSNGWLVKPADPQEWVKFEKQTWHWDGTDHRAPWNNRRALRRCMEVLKEFGADWKAIEQYADVRRIAGEIDEQK